VCVYIYINVDPISDSSTISSTPLVSSSNSNTKSCCQFSSLLESHNFKSQHERGSQESNPTVITSALNPGGVDCIKMPSRGKPLNQGLYNTTSLESQGSGSSRSTQNPPHPQSPKHLDSNLELFKVRRPVLCGTAYCSEEGGDGIANVELPSSWRNRAIQPQTLSMCVLALHPHVVLRTFLESPQERSSTNLLTAH